MQMGICILMPTFLKFLSNTCNNIFHFIRGSSLIYRYISRINTNLYPLIATIVFYIY